MTKQVLLSTPAQRQFEGLEKALKARIREALFKLANIGGKTSGRFEFKKLKGTKGREDLYRLRVGDYRLVFHEDKDTIKVIQILHRSRAYDWL